MAKRYKNNELRRAFLGNVFTTAKDRTTGAIFLGIIAAGDPFYSQENMEYLKKSVQELREGKGTKHELLEEEE